MTSGKLLSSPTRKETAEFFILGLRLGLFDTLPVIKWADSIIEQEDKPDISIINVSLAGNRGVNETIACLREIKGELRENVPLELMLAYYLGKLVTGQADIDQIAAMLYSLAKMPEVAGDIAGALYVLDENLSMAEDGLCGSVEEALDDIKCFLEEHSEYEQYLPRGI